MSPFDGHTLHEQIEHATVLMQYIDVKPSTAVVDLGYRGVNADNPGLTITHRGKSGWTNGDSSSSSGATPSSPSSGT